MEIGSFNLPYHGEKRLFWGLNGSRVGAGQTVLSRGIAGDFEEHSGREEYQNGIPQSGTEVPANQPGGNKRLDAKDGSGGMGSCLVNGFSS